MSDQTVDLKYDLEQLIGDLAEEYAQRLRAGEKPDIDEYVAQHPEAADALRQILPALEIMGATPAAAGNGASTAHQNGQPEALGDYLIVREVGRGGMGVVYEATQRSLNRRVALKVLPFAAILDERQIKRFRNEALAAAQLEHPNIVDVYGVGCERSVHFYAMRFVDGETLAGVITQLRTAPSAAMQRKSFGFNEVTAASPHNTPQDSPAASGNPDAIAAADTSPLATLSTQKTATGREFFRSAARIGREIALALDHAHGQGVIHRDIKPGNIMIDAAGKSWVTDFGLARVESGGTMTMTGDLVGTLRYMSPEQAMAKRVVVDHRTDIYSLGVTLYELVTLRPAWPDEDRHELLRKIAFEEPTPPRKLNRAVPVELETIILKAIAKNPNDRYETAQELADDLQRFLDDRPIRARRISRLGSFRRWCRRNPTVALSGFVTAAMLLLTLAVLGLSNRRIAHERDEKNDALIAKGEALDEKQQALTKSESEKLAARRLLHQTRIHLAEQDMQNGRYGVALQILEADRAADDEQDLRGFAANHLWLRAQERLIRTFEASSGSVNAVTYSPDGRLIASANQNGTIRLWEANTGNEVRTIQAHNGVVRSVAFSADGALIASAGSDGQVILWETATGNERGRVEKLDAAVYRAALSPDGRFLATHCSDGNVRLYNFPTLELHSTLAGERDADGVDFLRFSHDGRLLAAAGAGESVKLWDVATGKLQHRLRVRLGFQDVDFSPDGRLLITVGSQRTILLWNVASGEQVAQSRPLEGFAFAVRFAPSGDSFAVGFGDGTVMHHYLPTGRTRRFAHSRHVHSLAFSPDGSVLASAGFDGRIKLWKAEPLPPAFPPVTPGVNWAIAFSPDGKLFAADESGGIRLRDLATGRIEAELQGASAIGLAFSPDSKLLASGGDNGSVILWDVQSRQSLGVLQQGPENIFAVAFSPDGRVLATGGHAGTITLWDLKTRTSLGTIQSVGWVWSLAFSPDGKTLASGGGEDPEYRTVRLWDWKKKSQLAVLPHALGPVAFSPDGTLLACQSITTFGGVKLWDLRTKQVREISIDRGGMIFMSHSRLAFFPDGKTLAVVGDGRVTLWDVATGRQLPMLRALPHWAFSMGVAPDGQTLVTGGTDGTIQLFHARPNQQGWALRPDFRPETDGAESMLFPEDLRQRLTQVGYQLSPPPPLGPRHSYAFNSRGRSLFEQGQIDEAVDQYRQAIVLNPDYALAWNNLGVALQSQSKIEDAIDAYRRAVSVDPSFYAAYSHLTELLLQRDRIEEAIDAGRKMVAINPNGKAALELAWHLSRFPGRSEQDYAEALRLANAYFVQRPKNIRALKVLGTAYYRNGQWQDAIETLQRFAADREGADVWCVLAMANWQLGESEKARQWFDQALFSIERDNTNNAETLAFRSEAEQLLGLSLNDDARKVVALEYSQRLIQESPNDASLHFSRAELSFHLGRWREAADAYTNFVDLEPDDNAKLFLTYMRRSVSRQRLGQLDAAMADVNAAVQLEPTHAWAYRQQSSLFRAAGQNERAIESATTAIRLDPDNEWSYRQRAYAYQANRQFDAAIQDATTLISRFPEQASGYQIRAQCYMAASQFKEALADLSKAVRLDPDDAWTHHERSICYCMLHDFEKALQDSNRAIQLGPIGYMYSHRAWPLIKLERFDEAIADCDEAIRLDESDKWAWVRRAWARLAATQRGGAPYDTSVLRQVISDAKQALAIDPQQWQALNLLTTAHECSNSPEELVADLTGLIESKQASSVLFHRRATALKKLNRYADAADDYAEAVRLGNEDGTTLVEWCASLVAAGDQLQYRQRCRELLERYAAGADGALASKLALCCTLAPNAVEDWQLPLELAARAVAAGVDDLQAGDDPLAWLLVRAGRYQEAAQRLSRDHQGTDGRVEATRQLWLAMAQFHLQESESPKEFLAQADQWVRENPDCYLRIKLLHAEVQGLLAATPAR